MLQKLRSRLTYANVMATVAVFIALGGGAYASLNLPANSVDSQNIVNNQVKSVDVRNDTLSGGGLHAKDLAANSVGASEVQNGSLGTAQIDESSLQGVDASFLDGLDSSELARTGSEGWHNIGDPGEPAFRTAAEASCDWSNTNVGGFPNNPAGFFRDAFGVVHLRGVVKASGAGCGFHGAGAAMFILPNGYLPANNEVHGVVSNNQLGVVFVDPGGTVYSQEGSPLEANAKVWLSLDGLSFRCAPSGQNGCP